MYTTPTAPIKMIKQTFTALLYILIMRVYGAFLFVPIAQRQARKGFNHNVVAEVSSGKQHCIDYLSSSTDILVAFWFTSLH